MSLNNARIYSLRPFRELRIITVEKPNTFDEKEECVRIRILPNNHLNKNEKNNCTAEIFGKELVIDKDYIFGFNEKFSIYTYTGCVVQIKGRTLQEYESKNNSMKEYLSLSYILDAHRKLAKKKKTVGPRILITGNNNSGKSTACLLLCNYALKSGFNPFFIEADPKCTTDKIELNKGPGILSCFVYNNMNRKYSIDYLYGFLDIKDDLNLYYHLNECISSCVHLAILNNLSQYAIDFKNTNDSNDIYSAGFILSVPSDADLEVIQNLIEIYKINIVVVIDNSFLHYSLKYYYNKEEGGGEEAGKERGEKGEKVGGEVRGDVERREDRIGERGREREREREKERERKEENEKGIYATHRKVNNEAQTETMDIIGLPKFEGVIPSDGSRLRYCKSMWFYNYFLKDIFIGNSYFKKSHFLTFKCSLTNFVKLDSTSAVPLSALPADCKSVKIENVSASHYNGDMKSLVNCILGVSFSKDFAHVHIMNMAAFVHVKNVTEIENTGEEEERKGETEGKGEKEETEKQGVGMAEAEKGGEKENETFKINGSNTNFEEEIETEKDFTHTKTNNNFHISEEKETIEQNELLAENNEKKNIEHQIGQEEEKNKDYLMEILCPVFITVKNIPPYFVVPGNIKQIKF